MIAFVLSGGGNRGSTQVGALQALFEHDIRPNLVVGTSAGAMNAVAVALDPTPAGVEQLAETWLRLRRDDVFPGNPFTVSWRLLTSQGSLHDRRNFRRFVQALVSNPDLRFGDLALPTIVTATILGSARLRLFGLDPNEHVIDALMASTAIPPFFPPYRYEDQWLVDGAIISNLPIAHAIANGAHTVYALEIADDNLPVSGRDLGQTMTYSVRAMLSQQHELERRVTRLERQEVTIHTIRLSIGQELAYNDFRQTAMLIEEGRRLTSEYLAALPQSEPLLTLPSQPSNYKRVALAVHSALQRVTLHGAAVRTAVQRVNVRTAFQRVRVRQ